MTGSKQDRVRPPGNPYKKQIRYITQMWRRQGRAAKIFGIERVFLFGLLVFLMIMPAMAIRAVAGRYGLVSRKLAIEAYAISKPCILLILLGAGCGERWWAFLIAVLVLLDMFAYLFGIVLLREFWSRPVSYSRSLLLLGFNWIEFIASFALIYSFFGCLCSSGTAVTEAADTLYFSIVTAATVGFGDITPKPGIGRMLCSLQIVVSFVFVGTFVAHFVSNIGEARKKVKEA